MGTSVQNWEGNIGSKPEFKEFPNGNKEPRRLLRLNVYFDNSVPQNGGGYEDKGGFWMNIDYWHKDAEAYSRLFQKGMRVIVSGRVVMDNWEKDGEEYEALKIQANRVGILPHRIESVTLAASSQSQNAQQNQRPPAPQNDYPDDDHPF